jgi:predicted Zn-dependent protease
MMPPRRFRFAACLPGLLAFLAAGPAWPVEESLVPEASWISDDAAQWELGRQLAALRGREAEALAVYERLLQREYRREWERERLGLLQRLGREAEAEEALVRLMEGQPEDAGLQAAWASLLNKRGHAKKARALFERLIKESEGERKAELALAYAREMRAWGDFYRAEAGLEAYLAEHPGDETARLDAIGVRRAAQRWEEAEAGYRVFLLDHPGDVRALEGLAWTLADKKDHAAMLEAAEELLRKEPGHADALKLKALGLGKLGRREEAVDAWRRLRGLPGQEAASWIGEGRMWRDAREDARAGEAFAAARKADPASLEAALLAAMPAGIPASEDTPPPLPASLEPRDVPTRIRWAGLLAEEGYFQASADVYRAALAEDPEAFPAQLGLAEVLGANHDYQAGMDQIRVLLGSFPDNFKLLLTRARLQSWEKDYGASLETYGRLMRLNPSDPVPRREAARVASWDKRHAESCELYAGLWEIPVDRQLAERWKGRAVRLEGLSGSACPYLAYEVFAGEAATPEEKRLVAELGGAYREQKTGWLENRAKQQAWDRHFQQAEATYRELVAFSPGNQEAYFDLSQVQAALDLNTRARATYEQLLGLGRLHTLAARALEREQLRAHPAMSASYAYWSEDGRGGLSDIVSHRQRAGVEWPVGPQAAFGVFHELWIEEPERGRESFWAEGASVEASGVFNEWLRASAGITGKSYYDRDLPDTLTGFARVGVNAWDWAQFSFGYSRQDVLHNRFALQQGTQSDNLELGLYTPFNHWLDVETRAELARYDDGNEGVWVQATPSLLLLDHPHTLRLRGLFEYRDTRKVSEFVFEGATPEPADILYPYWSPQDYFRGQAVLEWRHDLSRDFYHGAELHYYALRLRGGSDTTDNPGIAGEAEWHFEFAERWMVEIKGTIERSREWDGESLWFSARCRL